MRLQLAWAWQQLKKERGKKKKKEKGKEKENTDERDKEIKLSEEKFGYRVFLHSPDFFMMNEYPGIVPVAKMKMEGNGGVLQIYISVKQKRM